MSLVGPADGSRLARSEIKEQSPIPTLKRKFSEVWAVANGREFSTSNEKSKSNALPYNGSRPIQADDLLTLNKTSNVFALQPPPSLVIDIIKPSLLINEVFKFKGASKPTSPLTNGTTHVPISQNKNGPKPLSPVNGTVRAKPPASQSPLTLQFTGSRSQAPPTLVAIAPKVNHPARASTNTTIVPNQAANATAPAQPSAIIVKPTPPDQGSSVPAPASAKSAPVFTNNGLSVPAKPPIEPLVHEDVSSPESTAATATTPIHDVSANTSPGNDSNNFHDHNEDSSEPVQKKLKLSEPEPDSASEAIRAQLLQDAEAVARKLPPKPTGIVETKVPPPTIPSSAVLNRPVSTSTTRPPTATPAISTLPNQTAPPTILPSTLAHSNPSPVRAPRSGPLQTQKQLDQPIVPPASIPVASVQHPLPPRLQPPIAYKQRTMSEIMGKRIKKPTYHTSRRQRPSSKQSRSIGGSVIFGKKSCCEPEPFETSTEKGYVPSDNYFTPLFFQTFIQSSKWMRPLEEVLHQAHKTITTGDVNIAMQDTQACRILRKVYHLQQGDKWSLRQLKRAPEPVRQTSHWDLVMREMSWMRTDFRQERKWKRALARNMALDCADWVAASPDVRRSMQVKAIIPSPKTLFRDSSGSSGIDMADSVVKSSDSDIDPFEHLEFMPPSALFDLGHDEVIFEMPNTVAAETMLEELPMYGTPLLVPTSESYPSHDPDAHWKRPALPLSKYAEGQVILKSTKPPKQISRFRYRIEDDEEPSEVLIKPPLPPTSNRVALFLPEFRQVRDRLHASHLFRPPTEFPMPSQYFYDNRISSQWTQAEDEELKLLVRRYPYNWSFISSMLSRDNKPASAAERRTAWECFERWVQLEGLPGEMQKTQYFKAWHARIDTAQNNVQTAYQIAQQYAAANPNVPVTPSKRRSSIPLKVERRHSQRYLNIIDGMRKLAKKREAAAQKVAAAAQAAASRKPAETLAQNRPTKTPRDYSLIRHERELQLENKRQAMKAAQAAQAEQRRQALVRQSQIFAAAHNVQNGVVNNSQINAAMVAQLQAAHNGRMPNAALLAAQQARRMPMAAGPGGINSLPAHFMAMNSANTANVNAAALAAAQRIPAATTQPELLQQAQRVAEQQRALQQQQLPNGQVTNTPKVQSPHSSPQLTQGVAMTTASPIVRASTLLNNQAIMNAMQVGSGTNLAAPNRTPHAVAAALASYQPRPPTIPPSFMPLYTNLENAVRAKHPNMPADQVRQLATTDLTKLIYMRQAQSNITGVAPGIQANLTNGMASSPSPQQYAAILRQQQVSAQVAQTKINQQLAAAQQAQSIQAQTQFAQAQLLQQTNIQQQIAAQAQQAKAVAAAQGQTAAQQQQAAQAAAKAQQAAFVQAQAQQAQAAAQAHALAQVQAQAQAQQKHLQQLAQQRAASQTPSQVVATAQASQSVPPSQSASQHVTPQPQTPVLSQVGAVQRAASVVSATSGPRTPSTK